MAIVKEKFLTSTAMTITLASLVTGTARESNSVDNSTNLAVDALIGVKVKTGASGVVATGHVSIYVYGSEDGTNFIDLVTGSDAGIVLGSPTNLKIVGILTANANATTYKGVWSISQVFGGKLPRKWGLVLVNNTGASLDSVGGSHSVTYTPIQMEIV